MATIPWLILAAIIVYVMGPELVPAKARSRYIILVMSPFRWTGWVLDRIAKTVPVGVQLGVVSVVLLGILAYQADQRPAPELIPLSGELGLAEHGDLLQTETGQVCVVVERAKNESDGREYLKCKPLSTLGQTLSGSLLYYEPKGIHVVKLESPEYHETLALAVQRLLQREHR